MTRIIPATATIAPLYLLAQRLGLVDTYQGLILILAAQQLPLALWLMKGFFDTVPGELEEAAWIDGTGRLGSAVRIVLPLAAPGVGAAALFAFIEAWGDFLTPFILVTSSDRFPLSVGLYAAYKAPQPDRLGAADRHVGHLHAADRHPLPHRAALPAAGHRRRCAAGPVVVRVLAIDQGTSATRRWWWSRTAPWLPRHRRRSRPCSSRMAGWSRTRTGCGPRSWRPAPMRSIWVGNSARARASLHVRTLGRLP